MIKFCQECNDIGPERLQLLGEHDPDQFVVNLVVPMHKHVPEPDDPLVLANPGCKSSIKPLELHECFTDDLKSALHDEAELTVPAVLLQRATTCHLLHERAAVEYIVQKLRRITRHTGQCASG